MFFILFYFFIVFSFVDNQEDNITESQTNKGKKFRLYDVSSEIHLQPSVEDDTVNYTCEALHEALPPWRRLRATVQLSVLCKYNY